MMAPRCTFCNQSPPISAGSEQTSFKKCAACHVVCYCSRDCQKSDWKYHKLVCKSYSEFMEKIPRPSPIHKLALVLHTKMETPKFFWIQCERAICGSISWEEPDVTRYFEAPTEPGEAWIKRYHVSKMLRLKFPDNIKYALDHTVGIYMNKDWALDGSQPNMCIDKVMKGEAPLKWAGLMIAFTYQGTEDHPTVVEDFNPADFRVVTDFFRLYGADGWGEKETQFLQLDERTGEFSHSDRN